MKADWLSFEDALRVILRSVAPLQPESAALRTAAGRVLAESVVSPIELPRWTNSAMDGFAVRGSDIQGAAADSPVLLKIVEEVAAGAFPVRSVGPGEATKVMTGAPIPDGADSVVRIEMTDGGSGPGADGREVKVYSAQDAGRNVRPRGEELGMGEIAVPAGEVVSPGVVGMAASLGYSALRVVRRPRVAVLASGDELVDLDRFDEVLAGRRIVSSNSHTLAAQLAASNCEVVDLGIARDRPDELREAILKAAGCDALITSAGISVGEHDYVREVLSDLETEVAFWRVKMRPGSPFAFGRIGALGGLPWFGLPGNPVSSAVTFELLARPALLRMGGHTRVLRRRIRSASRATLNAAPDVVQFVRVSLERREDGGWEAHPTGAQGSNLLSSFAKAGGLMIVPAGTGGVAEGSVAEVIPLEGAWMEAPS